MLPRGARAQYGFALGAELALETRDESKSLRCKDPVGPRRNSGHLDFPIDRVSRHEAQSILGPPDMQQPQAVRERYDRLAGEYDQRWAGYISASARHTLARARFRDSESVLDVGCGTGSLQRASGADLVGVDLSTAMLARACGRRAAADVSALPFPSQTFDVVASASSLHYWSDPVRALAEIRRVLKTGGRLVLTDWCDDYVACKVCDRLLRLTHRAYARAYSVHALRRIIERAGFQHVEIEKYKIGWLWGLMTAVATA